MLRTAILIVVGTLPGLVSGGEVDYERDVKPLLAKKCVACHGVLKQEAGLRLDAGSLIRAGSADGPVVVAGDAAASLLIERVTASDADERMPPAGEGEPLSATEVALISKWINTGADVPDGELIPAGPEEHWAFQRPSRPPLPDVIPPHGLGNEIDAFVTEQRLREQLECLPPADGATLLRRVYLDLIGLPPSWAEVREFLRADSEDAYLRIVDHLLQSPHYGERWGRHWMDVWRYSDWDGYKNELRGSQRHIWHWRDWIVESLNADKPYDQMLREMLAGDELAPEDPSVLAATGFLARNYHNRNRDIWLDATVEHTSKAFLGLTINCARCHDHKYDPLPQSAYYALRAIFEPHQVRIDRLPGQPDTMQDGLPRVYDAEPDALTFVYLQGDEKRPDKDHPVSAGVPASLSAEFAVAPVALPTTAYFPALSEHVEQEELAAARRQVEAAREHLAALQREVEQTSQPAEDVEDVSSEAHVAGTERPLLLAEARLVLAESQWESLRCRYRADKAKYLATEADAEGLARLAVQAERMQRLHSQELLVLEKQMALEEAQTRAEPDEEKRRMAVESARAELETATKARDEAQTDLESDTAEYTPVGTVHPATSTGRRLALARWITSRSNPLTARVAVNHIWMRHFGEPLVDNVFDFGLSTPRPIHAQLLDWLAVELMEQNWSMKHIHRLIVTSRTYRLASIGESEVFRRNAAIDADNRYLWRANAKRLDAEVIRDSLLQVSGRLNTAMGGPELDFVDGERVLRRSLYFRHAYEKQMGMLVLFDAASPNECYRRSESVIPQQALALANSTLSVSCARALAGLLNSDAAEDSDFVHLAFERILVRKPTPPELTTCLGFLDEQRQRLSDPDALTGFDTATEAEIEAASDPARRARESLVHVLMNHNDFVTVR